MIEKNLKMRGTNERQLMMDLHTLCSSTVTRRIEYELAIYSICKVLKDSIKVFLFVPDEMDAEALFGVGRYHYFAEEADNYFEMSFAELESYGFTKETIEEVLERGFFLSLQMDGKEKYLVPSSEFLNTMVKFCGGGKVPKEPDPLRDLYVAYLLREADPFQIVYREDGKVGRAITCIGARTTYVPQEQIVAELLRDIHEKQKYAIVSWYEINHLYTQIKVDLTELQLRTKGKDKRNNFYPGLLLTVSDTGDYANSIQTVIGFNGRMVKLGTTTSLESAISELKFVLKRISAADGKVVSKGKEVLRLAKSIGLQDVGQKVFAAYEAYLETLTENCTYLDVIAELFSFPSKVDTLMGKTNKQYITDKAERLLGDVLKKIS